MFRKTVFATDSSLRAFVRIGVLLLPAGGPMKNDEKTHTRVDGFPVLVAWGSTAPTDGGDQ